MGEIRIGLSTTYYATSAFSIYESVARAIELGFNVVELGTAHDFEEDIWQALKKIRVDFKDIDFTIHNLFPPLEKKIWFNPADGLTVVNKVVIDRLFIAAAILEVSMVSIHPPVLNEITLGHKITGNFHWPIIGGSKDKNKAKDNFTQLMEYIKDKAEKLDVKVLIENINTSLLKTYLSTKESFQEVFDEFSFTGLLLDIAHALQCGGLNELIGLDNKIFEIHLHNVRNTSERESRGHLPIMDASFYEPIKSILSKNSCFLIFEQGSDIKENQILKQKEVLRRYLEKNVSYV